MSIPGGDVKTTLTLDVSKFTDNLEKAVAGLATFDEGLKTAGKLTEGLQKSVGAFMADMGGVSGKFRALGDTIDAFASRLGTVTSRFDSVGGKARDAGRSVDALSGALRRSAGIDADKWVKRYADELQNLTPALRRTVGGLLELDRANIIAAEGAEKAAGKTVAAKLKTLEAERENNRRLIAERQHLVGELETMQSHLQSRADSNAAIGARYFGKNAAGGDKYRQDAAQAQEAANTVRVEAAAVEALVKELRWKNGEIEKSIALIHAEQAAEEAANKALKDQEAARRKNLELAQAQQKVARDQSRLEEQVAIRAQRIVRQASVPAYTPAGSAWWKRVLDTQDGEIRKFEAAQAAQEARIGKLAQRIVKQSAVDGYRPADEKWWEKALKDREAAEMAAHQRKIKNLNNLVQFARQAADDEARSAKETAKQVAAAKTKEAAAAREAANERKRQAREAADFEMAQARQVAQMWKGMGQLWAASKIEHGLAAGLGKASEAQRAEMRVKLLNLPTDEFEEFKKKAFDITKEERYISTIEAMQARLDALTSIGANHKEVIDDTMNSALRSSQIMLAAGYEHGSRSDLIKNLYGFAEARQVMGDPEKVKESFDIARRMGVASGGKINIADLETVARNLGDLRQTMSAEGWMNVAALMEQFKVAGSQGHGGAGAGVQSVGTILKMMSLYAAGKPVTDIAAVQLLGAGVMNDVFDSTTFKQGGEYNKRFQKMIKTAGFKNAADMADNPVGFFSGLRGQVLDYTKNKENAGQFYDAGANMNSEASEEVALKRFFAKMGLSQKTVDGMLIMMNTGFINRSKDVLNTAKNSASEQQSIEETQKTWANAVTEMKAGAESLAASFQPVLDKLSVFPRVIGDILRTASELARENPLQTQMALATVAAGGLTLAVKGAVATFGMVGGAMTGIRAIAGVLTGTTAATTAATGAFSLLRTGVLAASLQFPRLIGFFEGTIALGARLAAPFLGMAGAAASSVGTVGKLLTGFGGVLLKAVSWISALWLAWDIGWLIGKWVSTVKVGGISIGNHLQNAFLSIEVGWKSMLLNLQYAWAKFKSWFGSDQATRFAEIEREKQQLADYKSSMKTYAPTITDEQAEMYRGMDEARYRSMMGRGASAKKNEEKKPAQVSPASPPNTAAIFGPNRPTRHFEDAFARQFYSAETRAEIERLKLDTLMEGGASYDRQAAQEVIKMWMGGDLDDGKDPSHRKAVKGGKYSKNGVVSVNGKSYNPFDGWMPSDMDWAAPIKIGIDDKGKPITKTLDDLKELIAKRKQETDAFKEMTFAKERSASMDDEAAAGTRRLRDEVGKETDAMRALKKEFDRLEERNPKAREDAKNPLSDYAKEKSGALMSRARADLANYAADLADQTKQIRSKLTTDDRGNLIPERKRAANEFDAGTKLEQKKYEAYHDGLDDIIKTAEKGTVAYQNAVDDRALAEAKFNEYLAARTREREELLLSPIEKMAKQWHNAYDQIEQMETQWADGFIDNLHKVMTGGKADWRGFLLGMANDASKMMLKDAMADVTKSLFGGVGGVLKGVGGGGIGGLWDGVTGAVKGFWNTLTGATDATGDMTKAVTDSGLKVALSIAGTTQEITADQAATLAMMNLALAADGAAVALGATASVSAGAAGASATGAAAGAVGAAGNAGFLSDAYNLFFGGGGGLVFANGGIMTEWGQLPLQKYARGGIANMPQAAIFGEGSMPEAYVPLPDGRSIPVTLTGGGNGNQAVYISIVVNEGNGRSEQKSSSGDAAGAWEQMAQRLKAVVREEMLTQRRPGGLLHT